jgi:hypothetical protein
MGTRCGYYFRIWRNRDGGTESAGNSGCVYVQAERRNADVNVGQDAGNVNVAGSGKAERTRGVLLKPPPR